MVVTDLKKMTTLAVVFIALMFCVPAKADEAVQYISLQAVSLHFKKYKERQAVHPSLGYEYSRNRKLGWQAAWFKDSFGYQSGYMGVNYTAKQFKLLGMSVRLIGALNVVHKQFVKGGDGETKLVPIPIIELGIQKYISLNITGSPELDYANGKHTNGVVVMQLKLRWQQ
ncbi:MAG TPA: hypothetical protein DD827_00695 [Gammaproteobacteria bacterium]|nr:hypothetical protein [Gammaproteobacteria bacterium]